MPIRLPIDKAWEGFCTKFVDLQKQGRTIAESSDGRYRVVLSANSVGANIMVFDGDEIAYNENILTKQMFEDELTYVYDFYIESYDADCEEDDVELTPADAGLSDPDIDGLIDDLIAELSPTIDICDPFYEDIRADIRRDAEDTLSYYGYPTRI